LILGLFFAWLVLGHLGRINEDISIMLPDTKGELGQGLEFWQASPWSDKVFIRLRAESGAGKRQLSLAAAKLAARLPQEYLPYVLGRKGGEAQVVLDYLLQHLPFFLDQAAYQQLGSELGPQMVKKRLGQSRALLIRPQGFVLKQAVQLDPLGLRRFLLAPLRPLSGLGAMDERGFALADSGRQALIVAQCSVPPTDTKRSRAMLAKLDQLAASCVPEDIEWTVLSAHAYAVANAQVIRQDLRLVLSLSALGLVLVFAMFIRRLRGVWVLTVPLGGLLWATGVYALAFAEPSAIVLGFGSVLLGVGLDFGVHVYLELEHPDSQGQVVKSQGPLLVSVLTSCCGFLILGLSGICGIRQLSFLAVTGIIASGVLALYFLPAFLGSGRLWGLRPVGSWTRLDKALPLWAWLGGLLFLACAAGQVHFNGSLSSVGYLPDRLQDIEAEVRETWGGLAAQELLVVQAKTLQGGLRSNDLLYTRCSTGPGEAALLSLSLILPALETQQENLRAWQEFWDPTRRSKIESWLEQGGREYGFSRQAFRPFLGLLDDPDRSGPATRRQMSNRGLTSLLDLFLKQVPGGYLVFSYPGPDLVGSDRLRHAAGQIPDAHLVSRTSLQRHLGQAVKDDLLSYALLAFLAIAGSLFFVFSRSRDMLLAFLPPLSAVVCVLGLFGLTGTRLNLFHVAGIPLLVGLGVDYGIFMVYWAQARAAESTPRAVVISALSTALAFGSLALARHPALHSLGMAVFIGVICAAICALFVLPGCLRRESTC
jgi:predicted exporter